MDKNDIQGLIIITTAIFLLAPIFIILYISLYNRRKKNHLEEKAQMKLNFDSELLRTQIEIQEETFNHISQEIHDNISQVLSFVKLNLAFTDGLTDTEKQHKITESRDLVSQVITDLRHLSKSMSFDYIEQMGLVKLLTAEVDRINKSGLLKATLAVTGDTYSLGGQRELILFRIFQETLNNTLKHAHASQLNIGLHYDDEIFNLTLHDNGDGFLTDALPDKTGSGLKNIQNRAKLIGATADITSEPGKGCSIKLSLNLLEKQLY